MESHSVTVAPAVFAAGSVGHLPPHAATQSELDGALRANAVKRFDAKFPTYSVALITEPAVGGA